MSSAQVQHQASGRALSPVSGTPVPPPQWGKGQSGNPGGRPKGASVRDALRSLAGKKRKDGRLNAYAIAEELIETAIEGRPGESHVRAASLVLDQIDGPVDKAGASGLAAVVIVQPVLIQGRDPHSLSSSEWEASARQYLAGLPEVGR